MPLLVNQSGNFQPYTRRDHVYQLTSNLPFGILHTIAFYVKYLFMANPRSNRSASKQEPKPKTVQRTYRFDTKLFEAFEDDCATHLANPKRVIEALILHWLDASRDERAAMAHKHRERIGSGARDEE
jgi:hypothetical protein